MQLTGVHAVVPTAFHDDGALDLEGTAALVDAYGSAGVDGVLVLGVMGEAPQLDDDERTRVVRIVLDAAAGLPVTVGLGRPGPDQASAAQRAGALGADAVLAGLAGGGDTAAMLARVTDSGLPVVAQHHPAATGVTLSHDDVVAAVTEVAVAACKVEAPPTPDLVAMLLAADGPPALGGLSGIYLPEELEAGAVGAMTGLAVPELLVEVVAAFGAGETTAALDTYATLSAWLRLETMPGTTGLVARKEAWRQRGVIASSRVRRGAPLGAATKAAITRRLLDCGVELAAPWPTV